MTSKRPAMATLLPLTARRAVCAAPAPLLTRFRPLGIEVGKGSILANAK